MGIKLIADKILSKFGYTSEAIAKSWDQLWRTAQEFKLFGGKVNDAYKQVPSVFKAIKAISDNVPQAELIFKNWDTEKEEYPEDLIRLFEKPNPFMSGNEFKQAVAGFLAYKGEVIIIKTMSVKEDNERRSCKASGVAMPKPGKHLPAELWVFNPSHFTQIKDDKGLPIGWKFGNQTYSLEEVIHIKDWNPSDPFRGMSPTVPLKDVIDIDYLSLVYNKAFFENDASPGFMLTTEGTLTPEQVKRIQLWMDKRHQGASKAFKSAIFEAGLKPVTTGQNHRDMEFIEQKKYMRDDIIGMWRVPKAFFNITEDLNYATFVGQIRIFWQYTLAPILGKIEGSFNAFLVTPYNPKLYCEFDYSNVPAFQEEFKDKVGVLQQLVTAGIPLNDAVEKLQLGFKKYPWGNVAWIPFSSVPANAEADRTPIVEDPVPADEPDDDKDDKKSIIKSPILNAHVWKNFINNHTFLERKLKPKIANFFFEQRKNVLRDLEKIKDFTMESQINIDWEREDSDLLKAVTPYLKLGIELGAEQAESLLASRKKKAIADDNVQHRLNAYLQTRCNKIKIINRTLKKQVESKLRYLIDQEMKQGSTTEQIRRSIQDEVRSIYNIANSRALTIARTEMTGAFNGGSQLYYAENGISKQEWVSAGDELVRDSHQSMNGQVRSIGQMFTDPGTGKNVSFPGGDGDPEMVINCRCTLAPVVE